jgi:hypothetical protein
MFNRLKIFLTLLIATTLIALLEQGEISQWSIKIIPNHIALVLFLEFSVTLLEFQNEYLKYRKPEILFKIYDFFYLKWITFKIWLSLRKEDQREFNKQLIILAINNLNTGEKQQKIAALAQLYQFGNNSDARCKKHIYNSLVDAHYKESNEAIKIILVEAICHFHRICD